MHKITVRKSGILGKGAFTEDSIKKDEIIFEFSRHKLKLNHKEGCNCKICKRSIQVGKNIWLEVKKGAPGYEVNHSCTPNCYFDGKYIKAFKKIKAGEELTLDYATLTNDSVWKTRCLCKTKRCRKILGGVYTLSKKDFSRYKGHMPKYIEKSYLSHLRKKN